MKILALEHDRSGASDADLASLLHAETQAVWDLMQTGTIREIYFREGARRAVLILEADSVGAAQQTLARLPLVKAGLTEFECIGLQPYPGFARLFSTESSSV